MGTGHLPDFETIFDGVVYWLSRVLDRTGVRGGINTILSWLLLALLLLLAAASRDVCEPLPVALPLLPTSLPDEAAAAAAAAAAATLALFRVVHRLDIAMFSCLFDDSDALGCDEYEDETESDSDDDEDEELASDDLWESLKYLKID